MLVSPVCLAVVVWYSIGVKPPPVPTVHPPVPAGWQPEANAYVGLSVPSTWVLRPAYSDSNGDSYWSGPGGGVGESVIVASTAPTQKAAPPAVLTSFLPGESYRVISETPIRIPNATVAWRVQLSLRNGTEATAVHAWVRDTQTEVWVVGHPSSATVDQSLRTLTLAP
jgi:hypothetical protein